ncbi:VanZ family protein [Roseateles sp.]|jgi:VanZ family protein|uniref:VanZ family protein n=1 Tax=Roseateles sp. TaxID=1971397 RepID=UPI0037CA3006
MARRLPPSLPRRRSSASLLALSYAGLVVYASLYPFSPWQWPPGLTGLALLQLPWPRYHGSFDIQANLLGYLPLGLLILAASVRSGLRLRAGLLLALLMPALLSYVLEGLQYFLPGRVPSAMDWSLNTLGAALGGLLGLALHAVGGLTRWHGMRERWFIPQSAGALALLAIWPMGLLFPPPVPLGLGQVLPRLQAGLGQLLADTPWAVHRVAEVMPAHAALPPGLEALVTALGLLTPCLLALSVARPGARRLVLVLAAVGAGVLATGLSTALNFGPQHAWAWLTPGSVAGLLVGSLIALLMCMASRRAAAAWGLLATTALIALVSEAPTDPYLAQSLAAWELGRFIHFYGLAQWLGWLWPSFVLAWLLAMLTQRA